MPKKGGAAKWGLLIALVLGGGALGGYLYVSQNAAEEEPEKTGPAKVISAGDIPPDTQGPKGPKGNVDSSEGTHFKKGARNSGGRSGGGGGKKKEKKRKTYEITKTDDPLAGINK